jgi:deoxycytidylate deaminase
MTRLRIQEHLRKHPKDVRKATLIAFVMDGDTLISVGYNRKKFPTNNKFTYHAEEMALYKAGRRAKNKTLYVVRILKNGTIGLAYPCKNCQKMIERYQIRKTYYSL